MDQKVNDGFGMIDPQFTMLNSDMNAQECDATWLNSSAEAGYIKIASFVN